MKHFQDILFLYELERIGRFSNLHYVPLRSYGLRGSKDKMNGNKPKQKQPARGVPAKRCSENIQQIYRTENIQ